MYHFFKKMFNKTICSLIILSLCGMLFGGCASTLIFENTYQSWLGQPVELLKNVYGELDVYKQDGDRTIYKHVVNELGDCVNYWVVDSSGNIIDWWHTGKDCKLSFP